MTLPRLRPKAALGSFVAWVVLAAFALSCRGGSDAEAGPAPSRAPPAAVAARSSPAHQLLSRLRDCDFRHRGILIDVGSEAADVRRAYAVGPFDDVVPHQRGSATMGRVHSRRILYDFWLDEPQPALVVSLRGVGMASRTMHVYLDERRLGVAKLPTVEPGVVSLPAATEVAAGRHVLTLRFSGAARAPEGPLAELDWIRLGPDDDSREQYAAPTLRDVATDVALQDRPLQALVLRAPGSVRCPVAGVAGTRLKVELGYWGNGSGRAEVRLLEDGEPPVVLLERGLIGGKGAAWQSASVDLSPFAGRLVGVELRATESRGGGRIAFGEPRIVADQARPSVPASRTVVVIVLAGLDRQLIPPWGPVGKLTAFAALGRDGVSFERYRAPTTVVSGVLASLLTGLPPRSHKVEDPLARLSPAIRTVGEMIKEASGRAAMFTGVPMSFAAFGFERGWDKYESYSPVKDISANEPLVRATAWLREGLDQDPNARQFVLVHLRGGHPPWDLTRDEAMQLPPQEYTGPLEPRRGAITLANVRGRRLAAHRRLPTQDWVRLQAFERAALERQNLALKDLFAMLERKGAYHDALIVMMGDVATGDPPRVPFAPAGPVREDSLLAPLTIKFPGRALAGKRAQGLVTTADVPLTVLTALGLEAPKTMNGLDLFRAAQGEEPPDGRPLTATLGNTYATRWGPWLLLGELRSVPALCHTEVDPACTQDVLDQSPTAATALWRRTFSAEMDARESSGRPYARESVALDADTQAALKVFGY